jgi:hypothetical protein
MASQTASLKAEEKDPATESTPLESDVEHGHLVDLEVDVGKVLDEGRQHSIADETSPYPEGMQNFVFGDAYEYIGLECILMSSISPRCRS